MGLQPKSHTVSAVGLVKVWVTVNIQLRQGGGLAKDCLVNMLTLILTL